MLAEKGNDDKSAREPLPPKDTLPPQIIQSPESLDVDDEGILAGMRASFEPGKFKKLLDKPLMSPLSTSQLTTPDILSSMHQTAHIQAANNKQSTTPKKCGRKTKDDISPLGPKEQMLPQLPGKQIFL